MATPDPFSANILKTIISPKIVSDGTGGYEVKVDLVNVDNIYVTGSIITGASGNTGPAPIRVGSLTIGNTTLSEAQLIRLLALVP